MTPTNDVWQQCLGRENMLSGAFHVNFVGLRSLFSFISLTYNFVIMLCIGMGYTRPCVDVSFSGCNVTKSFNN